MRKILFGLTLAALAVALMAPLAAFAQGPTTTPNQGLNDHPGDLGQTPTYTCSVKSGGTPTITAQQAQAAALAANPGATALAVGLDDENGCLVYGVELSSGADVKVDAGNGQVVHTDAAGPEDGRGVEGGETPESGG
jgi:hypothetical protein